MPEAEAPDGSMQPYGDATCLACESEARAVAGAFAAITVWRRRLLDAWAKDSRALMTALLEHGPDLAADAQAALEDMKRDAYAQGERAAEQHAVQIALLEERASHAEALRQAREEGRKEGRNEPR